MPWTHSRTQHPVGQGSFHSASLSDGQYVFRYVYDCGAMSSYREELKREIDAFRRTLGSKPHLDVVFLSHAHADHVNGIRALLEGVAVDLIVLPLLTTEERLAAYARSVAADQAVLDDRFYADFVRDPDLALSRFSPGRVIHCRPSQPMGPGKQAPGAVDGSLDTEAEAIGPMLPGRTRWRFVGQGVDVPGQVEEEVRLATRETMPDSTGLAIDLGKGVGTWLLALYVDPGLAAGHRRFVRCLRDRLVMGERDAFTRERVIRLLGHDAWILREVYDEFLTRWDREMRRRRRRGGADLNPTSMCLYSGLTRRAPLESATLRLNRQRAFPRRLSFGDERSAWLGTGDAVLKEGLAVDRLCQHYGTHLDRVATLVLPHHGADGNVDDALLERVAANHCVVSADHHGRWRHPGSRTMQRVASRGTSVSLVTSGELSVWVETVD